ncbi:MAG: cysteine desulfurase family protein [Hyphomicrobiaceae bacterium]
MIAARTYLDYNATSPLRPEARDAMTRALDGFGNASSVHAEGRRARAMIEAARAEVAALAGADAREVTFTSGATEAANWVVSQPWQRMIVSAVEHPAVMAPALRSGTRVEVLPVDSLGYVDPGALGVLIDSALNDGSKCHAASVLVAVQHANNETGVVQPIAEIVAIARERGVRVLVDAVQTAGRVTLDQRGHAIDFMVMSSHKIGGPQGAGALVVREDVKLEPLLVGGGQERGRRAGTENVAAIAGFGAAAAASRRELERTDRFAKLRDALEAALKHATPDMAVIGGDAERLCNTTLVALPGASAETAVIALDLAGVAASAGAACSSGKASRSPVLAAMGIGDDIARCAVRFSLGWATTEDDIARCTAAWQRVDRIRRGVRQVA